MKSPVMKEFICAVFFCMALSFIACNQKPQVYDNKSIDSTKLDTLIAGIVLLLQSRKILLPKNQFLKPPEMNLSGD
jgi:hypothetical protein